MEVIYKDPALVVCVKPAGISSEDGPGSAPALLRETLGGEIYPVHRLDLNVGGLMVYARTRQSAAALSAAIQNGQLEKAYLAIVHGVPEPPEGTLEDFLYKDAAKRKAYPVRTLRKGAKAAKLSYTVLEARPDRALVRIALHTGRFHQIRVQFASRRHPLLGDGKYGARDSVPAPALWSWRLRFPHPVSGEALCFTREPPENFLRLLEENPQKNMLS